MGQLWGSCGAVVGQLWGSCGAVVGQFLVTLAFCPFLIGMVGVTLPYSLYGLTVTNQIGHIIWLGLILWLVTSIIYAKLLSPTRHLPGPLLSSLSSAPMWYNAIKSQRAKWVHALHKEYGPVVRVAPNYISVSDPSSIKQIYGGKFIKSDVYNALTVGGEWHCLLMKEPSDYTPRRKLLLPLFQPKNLADFEPIMYKSVQTFIDSIIADSHNGPVDFYRWLRLLAFDIICDLAYGTNFQMLKAGKTTPVIESMHDIFTYMSFKTLLPGLSLLAKSGFFPSITDWSRSEYKFADFGKQIYVLSQQSDTSLGQKNNLMTNLKRASKEDPDNYFLTENLISAESGAIMIAGSDTTSMSLVYFFWEMARNQNIQENLRTELSKLFPAQGSFPSHKDLESLEYLNLILKETLRLYPTLPGQLNRVVPAGGATICGHFLPGGVDVGMQAYSEHRNEDIFPQAESFIPDRWLHETAEMRNSFIPFSYGPRNCVGQNLAWLELRAVAAIVVRRFHISLASQTTAKSMQPMEQFFVIPKSESCLLHIIPVEG